MPCRVGLAYRDPSPRFEERRQDHHRLLRLPLLLKSKIKHIEGTVGSFLRVCTSSYDRDIAISEDRVNILKIEPLHQYTEAEHIRTLRAKLIT